MHNKNKDQNLSFEDFLKEMRPLLFSFVYRVCGEGEDAEDIVQNTMVEAFLLYSENKKLKPNAIWALKLAFEQLRMAISNRKPWQPRDHNLIAPIATSSDFWKKIAQENCDEEKRVDQVESFHIGFLTILQRLNLIERVLYVGIWVLGFSQAEMQEITGISSKEVEIGFDRANSIMSKHYYTRDPDRTLWRSEKIKKDSLEKFVKILNSGEREAFKSTIDPIFHCLMAPAPLFEDEIFFNDFLSEAPICRILDFELNGHQALSFADDKEVQAVAVAIFSPKGVSTLLGYDADLLSPKIRSLVEETE